jgi:homocitrate synthase NifV
MLDEIGIDQIEAGIPVMGGDEREVIEEIAHLGLKASVLGWNRANVTDIQTSIDCGVDAVAISLATSDIHIETKLMKDRQWVLDSIRESVAFAKSHGVYVSVNAEERRTGVLVRLRCSCQAEGRLTRLRDTIGSDRCAPQVVMNSSSTPVSVEMHTHNDFGMAVATRSQNPRRCDMGQRHHRRPGERITPRSVVAPKP